MADDKWKLVTEYGLAQYPNGLKAGERVRLTRELVHRDHRGKPTGEITKTDGVWTVLSGAVDEPEVIWLREPSGDPHTWDLESFFDWFEVA